MRISRSRSLAVLVVIGASSLLVACGGDDSSSNGALSIDEFCSRIDALESAVQPDDIAAAVDAIEGLVDSAPTDEVRDALETLVPVLSRMGEVDQNDPDAFAEFMELALDPKVVEASQTLETFGTEECGFAADDSESENAGTDEFPEDGEELSASAIDSTAILDHLEANANQFLNGGAFSSVAVQGLGDGYLVSVDTTTTEGVEAESICEVLAEYVDSNAPEVDVTIEVTTEGSPAVSRQPGGACES